jgi:hypothetical protein
LEARKKEALDLWEPLPRQLEFHTSRARERVFMAANQQGKTTTCCVEYALAFCGRHPRLPKNNGRAFLVAYDGKEVAEVMYHKLFRPGAFSIIRDHATGEWRTYKPWVEPEREHEAVPAPPLIPERFIKGGYGGIAWENKKANQPALVTGKTGWEFRFLTSKTVPPHGVQLDLVGFDEEIERNDWYSEMMARLIIRNGIFMWSVTPQVGTPQLYTLFEQAQQMEEEENPRVEFFSMIYDDNPYIKESSRADFKAQITNDAEYQARILGIPIILGLRVFPEFDVRKQYMAVPLREVPPHWTRYAFIDPGHQVCAVMFVAVPPSQEMDDQDFIYIYDELYLRNCTAKMLAEEMAKKCRTQEFQDFIIDFQGARVRSAGSGRSIESYYIEEFTKMKVASKLSGSAFTKGGSDVKAGVEAARRLMDVRDNGKVRNTKIRYFPDVCRNFDWEIKRWNNKRDPDGNVTDDPVDRGRVHLMACLRYLALYDPKYVRSEVRRGNLSYRRFVERFALKEKLTRTHINLGPGDATVEV